MTEPLSGQALAEAIYDRPGLLIEIRAANPGWTPDLAGVHMIGWTLDGIDLHGANFTNADLTFISLKGANLRGVNFSGAILVASVLEGADLTGAVFTGASLAAAALTRAKGADLTGALGTHALVYKQ